MEEHTQEEFHPAKQRIPVLFRGRIVPGVFGEIQSCEIGPADNPENNSIILTTTRHHWRVLDLEIQQVIRRIPSVNMRCAITPSPLQNYARYGVIIYYCVGDEDYLPEEMGIVDSSENVIMSDYRVWTDEDDDHISDDDEEETNDQAEDEEDNEQTDNDSESSVSTATVNILERIVQNVLLSHTYET